MCLGSKGRLTPSGVYQMIKDGGAAIGMPELHPHQPRHTFSHDWLRRGRLRLPRQGHPEFVR